MLPSRGRTSCLAAERREGCFGISSSVSPSPEATQPSPTQPASRLLRCRDCGRRSKPPSAAAAAAAAVTGGRGGRKAAGSQGERREGQQHRCVSWSGGGVIKNHNTFLSLLFSPPSKKFFLLGEKKSGPDERRQRIIFLKNCKPYMGTHFFGGHSNAPLPPMGRGEGGKP